MDPQSPTVWRRWLAFELRRLRDETGMPQKDAGKACGWSGARLSYIENAQQNVTEKDLRKLLPLYGVPKSDWDRYIHASRRSKEKGFWERYDDHTVPEWLSLYVGLEQGASSICCVDPAIIPGLLQTPEYTTAMLRSDVMPRTEQQIARIVEVRQTRQAVITRDESPADLSVVIDESVLRRPGGSPKAMADQIDFMVAMAARPNVTIRVVPFDSGLVAGLSLAYRLLAFPWDSDSGVVCIEHRDGEVYIEDAAAVDGHRLAFDHLSESALDSESSLALMRDQAEEYRRRA
jgi:transcriptional regulator with XRE-family HTH domain